MGCQTPLAPRARSVTWNRSMGQIECRTDSTGGIRAPVQPPPNPILDPVPALGQAVCSAVPAGLGQAPSSDRVPD